MQIAVARFFFSLCLSLPISAVSQSVWLWNEHVHQIKTEK